MLEAVEAQGKDLAAGVHPCMRQGLMRAYSSGYRFTTQGLHAWPSKCDTPYTHRPIMTLLLFKRSCHHPNFLFECACVIAQEPFVVYPLWRPSSGASSLGCLVSRAVACLHMKMRSTNIYSAVAVLLSASLSLLCFSDLLHVRFVVSFGALVIHQFAWRSVINILFEHSYCTTFLLLQRAICM